MYIIGHQERESIRQRVERTEELVQKLSRDDSEQLKEIRMLLKLLVPLSGANGNVSGISSSSSRVYALTPKSKGGKPAAAPAVAASLSSSSSSSLVNHIGDKSSSDTNISILQSSSLSSLSNAHAHAHGNGNGSMGHDDRKMLSRFDDMVTRVDRMRSEQIAEKKAMRTKMNRIEKTMNDINQWLTHERYRVTAMEANASSSAMTVTMNTPRATNLSNAGLPTDTHSSSSSSATLSRVRHTPKGGARSKTSSISSSSSISLSSPSSLRRVSAGMIPNTKNMIHTHTIDHDRDDTDDDDDDDDDHDDHDNDDDNTNDTRMPSSSSSSSGRLQLDEQRRQLESLRNELESRELHDRRTSGDHTTHAPPVAATANTNTNTNTNTNINTDQHRHQHKHQHTSSCFPIQHAMKPFLLNFIPNIQKNCRQIHNHSKPRVSH